MEAFYTLQGEGYHQGKAAYFIRLGGCDVGCVWCDVKDSWDKEKYPLTHVEEMVQLVRKANASTAVITGGEPMLQEREVIPLMQRLLDAGYKVLLETSGERPLERVPSGVIKIVDVKCPNSGEPDTFQLENLETLHAHDEIKFVLSDRTDYEFAREFVCCHSLAARVNAILFSPAFSKEASGGRDSSHCLLDPRELSEWMLADDVPARLNLQIHKFVWDPAMKGV